LAKKFSLLILLFSVISSCQPKKSWQTSTLLFFDTICEVNLFCLPYQFESAEKEIRRVFSEIELSFSPRATDFSSPLVLDLFEKSRQVFASSGGYFDITVAPLSRIWGFQTKAYNLPKEEEIKKTLNSVGMNKIREAQGKLILQPGMALDWGGIAKGLGVDMAFRSLKNMGISRGFINAGGDLYCWGKNPENTSWKIGIKHPRRQGFLGVLYISDLAVATSGDYQRYFERDGVRYHHIFNPYTGYPVQDKQSVTVIGPQTLFCDALSTALFASPDPAQILKKYPDYGAIIVDREGKVRILGKAYLFELL